MAGDFVGKIDCPRCGGEMKLNMWEEDGVRSGYCFDGDHDVEVHGKRHFFQDQLAEIPESDIEYTPQEPKDISWVEELQTLDNPERGLKKGAYKHFGVKHGLSTTDGKTVVETYYPRCDDSGVAGYKVRIHNPKKFYTLGKVRDAYPFGWKQALEVGGYNLFITEGEEDAVALFTAFMREKKQKVAVISLSQGATSVVKTLQPIRKHLEDKFKQIVYLPDYDDGAGEQATKDLQRILQDNTKLKVAKYSEKDANDMVVKGKERELVNACYQAGTPLSGAIKEFSTGDFELVKQAPEFGLSYPYNGLTELLRGIRLGTTVYFGAPEKSGKSTLVNEIARHLMLEHNEPVFAIKPEESEEGTLRRMAGAAVGKIFHDPKIEVDPEDVDRAAALLAGKLFVLERNQTPRWEEIRQLMREAFLVRGIKYFFIDPITNLTSGMSHSERDSFLHQMTRELAEDAKSLGYTVFLFCHLKTPKDGLSWAEGRIAVAEDFSGSRAMVQACDVAIAMQAWKLTEGDNAEYLNRRRVLHVIAEREYNAIGKVELVWNSFKGQLEEVDD